MRTIGHRALIALTLAGAAASLSSPAAARGCNGVVDLLKFICGPGQDNNGPRYPYYGRHVTIPLAQAQVLTKDGNTVALYKGQTYQIIPQGVPNDPSLIMIAIPN